MAQGKGKLQTKKKSAGSMKGKAPKRKVMKKRAKRDVLTKAINANIEKLVTQRSFGAGAHFKMIKKPSSTEVSERRSHILKTLVSRSVQ